jgi:phosphatidylinositol glycan class V
VLSPSPAALVAPYTEPLYAALTFSGMLALAIDGHSSLKARAALVGLATAAFAASTAVRPTGILNAGYLVWTLVVEPWLHGRRQSVEVRRLARLLAHATPDNHLLTIAPDHRSLPAQVASRLLLAAALTAAVAAPFIYAQVGFYRQFCLDRVNPGVTPPAWCAGRLPLLYTHVQRTYWYAVPANLIWTSPLCLSKLTGTL